MTLVDKGKWTGIDSFAYFSADFPHVHADVTHFAMEFSVLCCADDRILDGSWRWARPTSTSRDVKSRTNTESETSRTLSLACSTRCTTSSCLKAKKNYEWNVEVISIYFLLIFFRYLFWSSRLYNIREQRVFLNEISLDERLRLSHESSGKVQTSFSWIIEHKTLNFVFRV